MTHEIAILNLMKRSNQPGATKYMYENMSGAELAELSQIGTRLTALADSVANRHSKEREARRRTMSGTVG